MSTGPEYVAPQLQLQLEHWTCTALQLPGQVPIAKVSLGDPSSINTRHHIHAAADDNLLSTGPEYAAPQLQVQLEHWTLPFNCLDKIELSPHNPWTRIKREAKNPLQKRICTLKLTADHVMWDYFMRRNNQIPDRARYEILYIFKSHVTRLNSIFGKTTFIANKGTSEEMVVFSGIQFEIRNVTILDGKYCYDVDGNWREEDLCARDANANILDVFRNIEKKESDEHGDVDFDYPTEYDMNETTHDDDKESHGHIDSFQSEEAEVCLSYLFTARVLYVPGIKLNDPAQPLIGIARAAEQNIMAGICMRGGNIGLVTFVHINETYLPPPVTQLVFTHEVGHSFGAQVEDITVKFGLRQLIKNPTNFTEHASSIIDLIFHDNEEKCAKYFPANERPADGHYLMYSITQQGRELNNAIFSNCSRHIIGQILSDGHHTGCFQESKVPFCGNNVVEAGEECDCGMAGVCEDHCCHARGDNPNKTMLDCTLRQGAVCSGDNYEASCPAPTPAQVREDNFLCNNNGRVCDKGECTGSICRLIRWRECQTVNDAGKLSKTEREELCYVACQQKKTTECISTSNAAKVKQYPKFDGLLKTVSQRADQDGFPVQLPVGTPCNNEHGYCDVFRRCRGMNTDTALVRLKKCLTSRKCQLNFLQSYWWAVSLITIAGIIVMTLIVFFCSVHTESDNPSHEKKNPSLQWRDTLDNPRQSFGIFRKTFRQSFSRDISKYDGEMEPTDPGDEVVNIELLPHMDS